MNFPVTHSIPSADALKAQLQHDYAIEPIDECRYWQIGLNDTYLVSCPGNCFVLRVYRAQRRTDAEVEYELDAITHLSYVGIPVSTAISRKDGTRLGAINTPEGRRQYVLFTFAEGTTYSYSDDIQIAFDYGQAVARLHNATDDFVSPHQRFTLNLEFLLHNPLVSLKPFLRRRPTDWDYLCRLAERIEKSIHKLIAEGLNQGFCHGDTNGYNAHFTCSRQLTFFDFDFCGIGWRAYDLASFRWLALMNPKEDRWNHFLRGYTQIRPLYDVDRQAVPFLIGARQLWIDSLQIENGADWGFNNIDDSYFDRKLKYLQNLETNYWG